MSGESEFFRNCEQGRRGNEARKVLKGQKLALAAAKEGFRHENMWGPENDKALASDEHRSSIAYLNAYVDGMKRVMRIYGDDPDALEKGPASTALA